MKVKSAKRYKIPAALIRGGTWDDGTHAGVFAVNGTNAPSYWNWTIGFRCVRQ